jgi:uncharacterized protein DUF6599
MRRSLIFIALLWLAVAALAQAPAPILPRQFAGWTLASAPKLSHDPTAADPANAALLKELGFFGFETATYTNEGHKLDVKAIRFDDATGAYAAFTFYADPDMTAEKIGDLGLSLVDRRVNPPTARVLFFRGNHLVQANIDHVTAFTAAQLRELASDLATNGPESKPPSLPMYLPSQSLEKNTQKYVVGPVGLTAVNAPVAAATVDFSRGAEVSLAKYASSQGTATLTLVEYPTPQLAAQQLRALQSAPAVPLVASRRSGPIVALVTGDISGSEAQSLVNSVNYDAEVTWDQKSFFSKKDNIGNLIIAVFMLIGILFVFALFFGGLFGGFRIVMKKLFPDKVFDRREDVEIIRLKLNE